jgi:hypothetical protein
MAFPVRPEVVVNPYGSTAGAGSGEFHVYRHARARERDRMAQLTAQEEEDLRAKEWAQRLADEAAWSQERTAKRRHKRLKSKESKRRKHNIQQLLLSNTTTTTATASNSSNDTAQAQTEQSTFGDNVAMTGGGTNNNDSSDDDDDEDYAPVLPPFVPTMAMAPPIVAFPNDGSFLERMKLALQAQELDQPSASPATEAHQLDTNVVEGTNTFQNDSERATCHDTNDNEDTSEPLSSPPTTIAASANTKEAADPSAALVVTTNTDDSSTDPPK